MLDPFYTRPNHRCCFSKPSRDDDFAKFVKGESPPGVSKKLSFDLVVNGGLRYPCRQKDLMNYLRFVEHSSENLKFYLWFHDYMRRFEVLGEEQKAMSPPYQEVDTVVLARPPSAASTERVNVKQGQVGTVVEEEVEDMDIDEDCINQPFRRELGRICELFIISGAPLELNISSRERNRILRGVRTTTHPSALKPAIQAAEYTLRWQSHPAFLRRQLGNSNPARQLCIKIQAFSMLFILGPLMTILLVMSDRSRAWRVFPAFVMAWGATSTLGMRRRLCWHLTMLNQVQLDPWEDPEQFGVSLEEGATFNAHKRSRSNSSTQTNLELQQPSSSNPKTDEGSKRDISHIARLSSESEVTLNDEREVEGNKVQVERYRKNSWVGNVLTKGVCGVEEEVRRTQVHMVYQQGLLFATVLALMLVITLPLPEYGIIGTKHRSS